MNDISAATRAANWWRSIQDDRGARARLRRADAVGVLTEPAFHVLHRALSRDAATSTRVALVMAHVSSDVGQPLGKTLSGRLSLIRFRRLLQARDVSEFRRAVDICGGAVNVRELAGLLIYWTDDERGDRARARLAFDYFGALEAGAEAV